MDLRKQVWSICAAVGLLLIVSEHAHCEITWEVPRFDGWYNSLGYPRRGSVGSHLVRLVPAHYWDGVYQPVREPLLPNPRRLSSLLTGGPSGLPSTRNQTVLSLFFGYHVSSEIFDLRTPGCPPEFMNIPVPKGDPFFDPAATGKVLLPFQRGPWDKESGQSPSNPRTQVNLVTAWIDGSSIYGPSTSWSDSLRSFSGGLLTAGSEWNMPNQATGRSFMWSATDPSTGEHGPHGIYATSVSPRCRLSKPGPTGIHPGPRDQRTSGAAADCNVNPPCSQPADRNFACVQRTSELMAVTSDPLPKELRDPTVT